MSILSGTIIDDVKNYKVFSDGRAIILDLNKMCHNANTRDGKQLEYYLSVDASTTCTGFCLSREDLKFHIVFDYERKDSGKTQFIEDLRFIFNNLVFGLKVKLLLVERPIQQAGGRSGAVLNSLSGDIKKFIKEVPEFMNVRTEFVRPNSWKSAMIIKSKGTGRYNSKACMAEDIAERYPIFQAHLRNVRSKDYDSFDAIGILYYYLEHLTDEEGRPVNFSTIEFTHHSSVAVAYTKDLECLISKFPRRLRDAKGVQVMQWNNQYSYYENIKMASTLNKIIVIPHINDMHNQLQTCCEVNLPYTAKEVLVLFVFRTSLLNKSDIGALTSAGFRLFNVY